MNKILYGVYEMNRGESEIAEYRKSIYNRNGGTVYLANDVKILDALIASSPSSVVGIQKKSGIGWRGVINKHLKHLIERDWVHAVIDAGKKRKKYCITPKGREAYQELRIEAETYDSLRKCAYLVTPVKHEVSPRIAGVITSPSIGSSQAEPKIYQAKEMKPKEDSFIFEFTPDFFSNPGSLTVHWDSEVCPHCGKDLLLNGKCPFCSTDTFLKK